MIHQHIWDNCRESFSVFSIFCQTYFVVYLELSLTLLQVRFSIESIFLWADLLYAVCFRFQMLQQQVFLFFSFFLLNRTTFDYKSIFLLSQDEIGKCCSSEQPLRSATRTKVWHRIIYLWWIVTIQCKVDFVKETVPHDQVTKFRHEDSMALLYSQKLLQSKISRHFDRHIPPIFTKWKTWEDFGTARLMLSHFYFRNLHQIVMGYIYYFCSQCF